MTYSFDPTGLAASNKVVNETIPLTAGSSGFKIIYPANTPIFTQGSSLTWTKPDTSTQVLVYGIDYYEAYEYAAATLATGKKVALGFVMLAEGMTGSITIDQYQVLGSDWSPSAVGIANNSLLKVSTTSSPMIDTYESKYIVSLIVLPALPDFVNNQTNLDQIGLDQLNNSLDDLSLQISNNASGTNTEPAFAPFSNDLMNLGQVDDYPTGTVAQHMLGASEHMATIEGTKALFEVLDPVNDGFDTDAKIGIHILDPDAHPDIREDIAELDQKLTDHNVDPDAHFGIKNRIETIENLWGDFDIKTLPGYEGVNTDTKGPYPVDSIEENKAVFRGGFRPVNNAKKVDGPILAKAHIQFADERANNNRPAAFFQISSRAYRLPIADIQTIIPDSPVALNLFPCTDPYDVACTRFIYKGFTTIHTNLSGNLDLLIRVNPATGSEQLRASGLSSIVTPDVWLSLEKPNGVVSPDSVSTFILAQQTADEKLEVFKIGRSTIRQYSNPVVSDKNGFDALLALFPSGFTELPYTAEQGFIAPVSISATLGTGTTSRTTSWVDSKQYVTFYIVSSTYRLRRRIQYMDEFGRIHFDSWISITTGAVNPAEQVFIYTPPSNARYWRIYYSAANEVPDGDLKIYAMNESIDSRCGYWVRYKFNFNKLIALDPDVQYSFKLEFFRGERTVYSPDGFGLVNGDAVLDFNVRDHLQKKYEELSND